MDNVEDSPAASEDSPISSSSSEHSSQMFKDSTELHQNVNQQATEAARLAATKDPPKSSMKSSGIGPNSGATAADSDTSIDSVSDDEDEESGGSGSSEDEDGADMEAKIEKELNKKQLIRLEKMFLEADADGGGTLDIDEFVAAMKTIMPHLTEKELGLLFMKIDANCDENVDWDEYLGYMLLEFQEKDNMQSMLVLKPFPRPSRTGHPSHKLNVIKLMLIPCMRHVSKHDKSYQFDYVNGSLLSVSKDGLVNFWSPTLEFRRTEPMDLSLDKDTPNRRASKSNICILDACSMLNVNAIAATTTNRDIHIYDTTGTSFWRRYHVVQFNTCMGCIDYWFNKDNMNQAIMLIGDNLGTVTAFVWHTALHGSGLFSKTSKYKKQTQCQVITLEDILKGQCITLNAIQLQNLHNDWVTSVKYFEKARNNFFLSCCSDFSTAMFFGHINLEEPSPEHNGHYFKHSRGINCFEYRSYGNVIITGQSDGLIKLWDPFIMSHSVGVMKGHSVAVVQLKLDVQRDLLISISKDNVVIVWNMTDGLIVQTLPPRAIFQNITHRSIGAIAFNPQLQSLAIATNVVMLLEQPDPKELRSKPVSHNTEITTTLFNDVFSVIVSTDIDSTIAVFDVFTGHRIIQFANAHTTTTHGLRSVEITATCFVEKKTRLITGAADGTMKIWNFNNGQILRTMETFGNVEVTCIVFAKECIFAAGWNKRVTVFVDGVDNEAVDPLTKVWPQKHKEDIMSMAANENFHSLVTGSYDGEMIIWNYDTGYVLFRLDATKSRFPITALSLMALKEMGHEEASKKLLSDQRKSGVRQKSSLKSGGKTRSKQSLPNTAVDGKPTPTTSTKIRSPDSVSIGLASDRMTVESGDLHSVTFPPIHIKKLTRQGDEIPEIPAVKSYFGKLIAATYEETKNNVKGDVSGQTCQIAHTVCIGQEKVIELPFEDQEPYCDVFPDADEHKNSIERLLFLKTREQKRGTATVISGDSGGWVRGWSTHPQGGLVGQFHAAFNGTCSILCMDVDDEETMLFIGDSSGHIAFWDIQGWCEEGNEPYCTMDSEEERILQHPFFERFPYLFAIAKLRHRQYDSRAESLPEHLNPWETIKVPVRLNCWLAHVKGVIALQYVDEKELLVTGSSFGTIRLWTIMGSFIGAFGQDKNLPWEVPELVKAPSEEKVESVLELVDSWGSLVTPTQSQQMLIDAAEEAKKTKRRHFTNKRTVKSDLLRIASALSLRVFNQGSCPYWKYAKNIILIWCVRFAGNRVEDSHKIVEVDKPDEWPGVPPKSDILGITYHPIPRYKEPLDYKKLITIDAGQLAVYHCVPLIPSMTDDNANPETPICVKRHQEELQREKRILGAGHKSLKYERKQPSVKLPPINQ